MKYKKNGEVLFEKEDRSVLNAIVNEWLKNNDTTTVKGKKVAKIKSAMGKPLAKPFPTLDESLKAIRDSGLSATKEAGGFYSNHVVTRISNGKKSGDYATVLFFSNRYQVNMYYGSGGCNIKIKKSLKTLLAMLESI